MSSAGDLARILLGILLMLAGIAWYFMDVPLLSGLLSSGELVPLWRSLLIVFGGVFGLALLFVGLILTWLSYDEYKAKGGE